MEFYAAKMFDFGTQTLVPEFQTPPLTGACAVRWSSPRVQLVILHPFAPCASTALSKQQEPAVPLFSVTCAVLAQMRRDAVLLTPCYPLPASARCVPGRQYAPPDDRDYINGNHDIRRSYEDYVGRGGPEHRRHPHPQPRSVCHCSGRTWGRDTVAAPWPCAPSSVGAWQSPGGTKCAGRFSYAIRRLLIR